MKIHFFLFFLLFPTFSLLGIDNQGPKLRFWQKLYPLKDSINLKFPEKVLKPYDYYHQQGSALFNSWFGVAPKHEERQKQMNNLLFGLKTDYEEVQITLRAALPWYKKSPLKVAGLAGGAGLFVGTWVGWKLKSFFSGSKRKPSESE